MKNSEDEFEDMPAEVDFSKGVRGRFAGRLGNKVTLMQIDEDVAQVFPSAAELNAALRVLIKTAEAVKLPLDRKAS
jgi:hypothetical protein